MEAGNRMKSQIQLDVGFDKDFMKILKKKVHTQSNYDFVYKLTALLEIPRNSEVRSNKTQ